MEKPLKPASPERMAFLRERVKEADPFAPERKPLTEEEAIEIYMNTSPFRVYLADDNPFKVPKLVGNAEAVEKFEELLSKGQAHREAGMSAYDNLSRFWGLPTEAKD